MLLVTGSNQVQQRRIGQCGETAPQPLEQALRSPAGSPTSPTSRSVRSVRPRSEPEGSCPSCMAAGGMITSADIAAGRPPGRIRPSRCAPTKAAPRSLGRRPSPVRNGNAPRSPTPSPGIPREPRNYFTTPVRQRGIAGLPGEHLRAPLRARGRCPSREENCHRNGFGDNAGWSSLPSIKEADNGRAQKRAEPADPTVGG